MTGAVASPFDSWLTLRGIRTLAARMAVHQQNASEVSRFLEGHSAVTRVYYPGLPDHPQHELASRQMRGFGGMVSFDVAGGAEAARRVLQRTRVFVMAASLGGVESIVSYPALMSHAALTADERRRSGIGDGLLRLSVGIEDAGDLCRDLQEALS
jgi:cystathionine beta-lyase/cystathionine gamma-synthase